MNGFISVFKREVKGYFATPVAYLFMIIFLIISAWFTFFQNNFFGGRVASMRAFFISMPFLLLFLGQAISMRLWSEERRSNSIELLFSLPITTLQAVLAKFAAAWTVMIMALALTFPMVITLDFLGEPDYGPIITGYLGCICLSGIFIAMGSFFSALTKSQVIALIVSVVVGSLFILAGSPALLDFVGEKLPLLANMIEALSFQSRFESIQRGVLEVRDVCYFLIFICGWLWANIIVLEERKAA